MNVNELNKYIKNQKLIKSMHHNYQKGNIVRFDGQEMKIKAVLENPFDGELSGFVVCEPIHGDVSKTKTIHVDELSFENIGDSEGFKL